MAANTGFSRSARCSASEKKMLRAAKGALTLLSARTHGRGRMTASL